MQPITSDVNKANSVKAKAKAKSRQYKAKAKASHFKGKNQGRKFAMAIIYELCNQ